MTTVQYCREPARGRHLERSIDMVASRYVLLVLVQYEYSNWQIEAGVEGAA